jgi:ATP-dependent protease HslVU (ClpYQ) peptidase subunit
VQPKPTIKEDLNTYMTQKFIPQMRKNFVDAGIDMKEDGDVAQNEGGFLVSIKGQVFSISDDYSWDTDVRNVYVMGSGGDVALGALAALGVEKVKTVNQAETMIRKAIAIAIQYDNMCSEPIHTFIQFK